MFHLVVATVIRHRSAGEEGLDDVDCLDQAAHAGASGLERDTGLRLTSTPNRKVLFTLELDLVSGPLGS